MTAESLSRDLAGKPEALIRLAERFPRWDPYAALPALLDDEPAAVRFLGLGAARHACEVAAARLRRAGIAASADFSSSAEEPPAGPETLVVAVSLGGGQRELYTVLDRYVARSPVIVLAPSVDSVVGRQADLVVPLHAGEEASGVGCRAYQHALALLLLLGHRLGAPVTGGSRSLPGLLRRAANATASLLESAPGWVPEVARVLESPHGVHMVAPAERMASAWQGVRVLRQGPVRVAHACETGEWSHTDRHLAAVTDYRALLFAGSAYDERFAQHLGQLRGAFVAVGPTPGQERMPEAELTVRYPGDTDQDVSLLVEPLVAELLAAHWWRGR
ncbi:SIS domain-containing protein [Nocardiopsis dassonvillei]|uniref:SIS domain-containing protein n=1 Tax=Nocardiopsis TaxID=2013 RepID=UPI00200ED484|nr:SIS domain-containing protein [Nocardiopsis dassonvillei]MCK9869979.1 SIS domain-containing protein [Nocardiopsis dassonvillei]